MGEYTLRIEVTSSGGQGGSDAPLSVNRQWRSITTCERLQGCVPVDPQDEVKQGDGSLFDDPLLPLAR